MNAPTTEAKPQDVAAMLRENITGAARALAAAAVASTKGYTGILSPELREAMAVAHLSTALDDIADDSDPAAVVKALGLGICAIRNALARERDARYMLAA